MDRVFKRNLIKQVKKWQYNSDPERKLQMIHAEVAEKSKD